MAVTPQVIRVASAFDLETQVNAYFASLFGASSVNVLGITLDSRSNVPFFNANFAMVITTDPTGAMVQASPYQFTTFTAPIEADALTLCRAFIAANPTFFFSQIFSVYRPEDPDPIQGLTIGLFFCSDKTNATANWRPISGSSGTSGAAGGDLSGTYPNPTVVGWRGQPLDPVTMAAPVAGDSPQWDGTKWVSVAAAATGIPTGITVWVDSVFGNDGTGLRQQQDKPFLTLAAAITAAVSGDTVYVRPGTYAMGASAISKNGVTVYAPSGVTITYTSTLVGDVGVGGTFALRGAAALSSTSTGRLLSLSQDSQVIQLEFNTHSTTAAMDATTAALIGGAGTTVNISCANLSLRSVGTAFSFDAAFSGSASSVLNVNAIQNISNTDAASTSLVQARGVAACSFICGRTCSSTAGSVVDGITFTGSTGLMMMADTFSAPVGLTKVGSSITFSAQGRVASGTGGAGINCSGGTITMVGFQTISGTSSGINCPGGTVLLIGSPNVSASAGSGLNVSGGTVTGSANAITGTTNGILTSSGTVNLGPVLSVAGSAGPGVNATGGTTSLFGFNTITGTTSGVTIAGGAVQLTGNTISNSAGASCINVTSGANTSTFNCYSIGPTTASNAAVRMTGGTNTVIFMRCRLIGAGAAAGGAAIVRNLAVGAGALVLQNCTLVSAAANSCTATVATQIIANTPCSSNKVQDANTTFLVNALTVNVNVQ